MCWRGNDLIIGETFGGSIKLAIEGDALARFALFSGDDCVDPNGLSCFGASIVDDRMGS